MLTNELILTALGIIGLFVLIALAFRIVSRARRELTSDARSEPADLLASLESAYTSGELDSAEFERVKLNLQRGPAEAETTVRASEPHAGSDAPSPADAPPGEQATPHSASDESAT